MLNQGKQFNRGSFLRGKKLNHMLRIDAHQHFWKFDPVRDSWINDEMKIIQRDFFPGDLETLLKENGFDGSVVVQSDQSEEENNFHLQHAEKFDFIKGIVGWVDLRAENIEERLQTYSSYSKIKGFRHVLQGEPDRALMLKPDFLRGIRMLEKFGFTYDILIFPDQLKYARDFAALFPHQKFIIDHIAKPYIKDRKINEWKKDIHEIAAVENVSCKISGMITEADWKNWTNLDLRPYIDTVVEAFGTKRILYGSDWPVCLVAGSYQQTKNITEQYFVEFSKHEQDAFFGGNAVRFYDLV
jgi:L-fuconolactonase